MTTNCPDKLDPALIRPGRINMQMHLTYMIPEDFMGLVAHHYGELTPEQRKRLKKTYDEKSCMYSDFRITPAEVEQLCSEKDTIEDFIEGLRVFAT